MVQSRLEKDVDAAEERELRRLEDTGTPVAAEADLQAVDGGPDAGLHEEASLPGGLLVEAQSDVWSIGDVVEGAAQRSEQLESKKQFRPSAKITGLMPHGGAGLKAKVPKRREFGAEGDEGDAAHEAAMEEFSLTSFGTSHVQDRTIDKRMCQVGLFGDWLQQNNFGAYVRWQLTEGARGKERCMVAVERDGSPRIPSEAAMKVRSARVADPTETPARMK